MDAFTNLSMGFQIALSPYNLMIATVGILLGTIIGVLTSQGRQRGHNPAASDLRHAAYVGHYSAVVHLLGAPVWGSDHLDSLQYSWRARGRWPRPLTGIPWQKQGLGGQALTAAFRVLHWRGFCYHPGDLFAPLIAEFSLHFGPPEFLGIQLLTFSAFVGLGGASPVKTMPLFWSGLSSGQWAWTSSAVSSVSPLGPSSSCAGSVLSLR